MRDWLPQWQNISPSAHVIWRVFYAQSVEEYVLSVCKLEVPVNPWFVPYPGALQALINDAVPKIKV